MFYKKLLKYRFLQFFLLFASTFFNFWIFRIYEFNFLLGEVMVILTLLLYFSFNLKGTGIIFTTFILTIFFSIFLLFNYFNRDLFSITQIDLIKTEQRKNFYSNDLGKLYRNRLGVFYFDKLRLHFSKAQEAFFSPLEWTLYFSPKRLIDYEKFSLFLSPLFITGLLYFIVKSTKKILLYFLIALITHTFTILDSKISPLLFFPISIVCINQGILIVVKNIKYIFNSK